MPPIHKPGTFLRIPLADGTFGYARVLQLPFYAFYQHGTPTPGSDLDKIASAPVLFRIAVKVTRRSPWEVIGWRELEEPLTQPIVEFRQDRGNPNKCIIFDTAGNKRAAKPEECIGLERMSVWEEHGAALRLLDALMGRPNDSVEHSKVRLPGGENSRK